MVEATTSNLSSDGVYFQSAVPAIPGEQLQCSILLTPPSFRAARKPVYLECRVRVLRVEETKAGFGVGCRIEAYSVTPEQRRRHAPGRPYSLDSHTALTHLGWDK